MYKVDINCDMGEGMNTDHLIMPYISSCSIACGGHAGGIDEMEKTVDLAIKHNVKIGAHPSYPDRKNFGRKPLEIDPKALSTELKVQIARLIDTLNVRQTPLHHVKPHGALYNKATEDRDTALAILDCFDILPDSTALYAPPNSLIADEALNRGLKVITEAFADRSYYSNLSLINRSIEGSILLDETKIIA